MVAGCPRRFHSVESVNGCGVFKRDGEVWVEMPAEAGFQDWHVNQGPCPLP